MPIVAACSVSRQAARLALVSFMANANLRGEAVLLGEQDSFIAGYVGSAIAAAGAHILGPARTVEDGLGIIAKTRCSLAVASLNVELTHGPSWPIAAELKQLGIPYIFVRSQSKYEVPDDLAAPTIKQPFGSYQVAELLSDALEGHRRLALR